MKRLLHVLLTAASSRAMPPLVIGGFFLVYIGIAFFTDETLITLMALTRRSVILAALLALIPLNSALRIMLETGRQLKMRRTMNGKTDAAIAELFDEAVTLPGSTGLAAVSPISDSESPIPGPRSPIPASRIPSPLGPRGSESFRPQRVRSPVPEATSSFAALEVRLAAEGYKVRHTDNFLAAWRGISNFPVRLLFLAGTFCLFTGILVSTTTRTSQRQMVIEGEPLATPAGIGGMVERIALANSSGSILSRTLDMEVAQANAAQGKRIFGIYPPALYGGAFVYPRYLGLAILLRFSAPEMPSGYETHGFLNCFPPGKEDNVAISGSPYRVVFSVPEPDAGSDRYISYMTGSVTLQFKLLKGKEVLFTGSVPGGGEFVRDGYRLALPDVRRMVVTDFIGDYGVLFIWAATLFFVAAGIFWLPLRALYPRREMLFREEAAVIRACSRAEGRARSHAGVFHEALDLLAAKPGATADAERQMRDE